MRADHAVRMPAFELTTIVHTAAAAAARADLAAGSRADPPECQRLGEGRRGATLELDGEPLGS